MIRSLTPTWIGALIGLISLAWMSHALKMPIQDPQGSFLTRVIGPLIYALVVIIIFNLWAQYRHNKPDIWRLRRLLVMFAAFGAFQLIYLAYRNLKSWVPLVRSEIYDRDLQSIDTWLFDTGPGPWLHNLIGTNIAEILSYFYLIYIPLIPLVLAIFIGKEMWPALNALSLNWLLGAAGYYLIPSLGPVFIYTQLYDQLPITEVTQLQNYLITMRLNLLADPIGSPAIQSIGAFPSLHVSVTLTFFGLALLAKNKLWSIITGAFALITIMTTIYFGWHYLLDLIGGATIALISVLIAYAWEKNVGQAESADQP